MTLQIELAVENEGLKLGQREIADFQLWGRLGCRLGFNQERMHVVAETGRIRGQQAKRMHARRSESGLLKKLSHAGRLGGFVGFNHSRWQFPCEPIQRGAILPNNRYTPSWRDGEDGHIVGLIEGVVGLDAAITEINPPFYDSDPWRKL